MQTTRPLNDAEINELNDLLASTPEENETFDVSMLDGFLSGIAVMNPPVAEEEWYPLVFDIEGKPCETKDPARTKALIMRRFNEIRAFQAAREFYNPVIFPLEDDKGEPVLSKEGLEALAPWATGFYGAVAEFSDRVNLTEEVEAALCNIHRFLELDTEDEDYEQHKALREDIETECPLKDLEDGMVKMMEGVITIARVNNPNKPVARETPKVGRNNPCPCGSGKKYKQCCGKN